MWDGYFTLGGNEIGNSARAIGYTRTAPCPIPWIRDRDCGGIAVATGDDDYFYTNISEAPWYDPDDPDTSGRFLGLYVVDIAGLSDSTRTATITEKITDGAQVSGYRHTAREVRVRGVLTGAGEDALEYGMTWLRNALSPDACGVHGGDCGASDFQFFVSCPPPRGVVPELTPYTVRTNTVVNPRMDNSTTGWEIIGATNAQTQLPGGTRIDILGALATNNIFFRTAVGSLANSGQQWAGSMEVSNPSDYPAITLKLAALAYAGSTLLTTADGPTVVIQPGQTVRLATSLLTTVGAASNVRLALKTADATPAGRRVFVRNALLEQTTADGGSYFDGTFPDVSEDGAVIADYAWTGTANNSTSTASTRSWTTRPETDEEYAERTLGLHRVLHTVTTVSGPLVQQELVSSDNTHFGYLVEFTLIAGVPFVYGATRDIPVPPTTPTVMQDVVYNLVPVPSAELSSGSVLTATNYSTNPSVETDATGWGVAGDGAILTANIAGARSTELAASGVASYRGLFTAPGASAVTGNIYLFQTVTLPSTVVAGDRYSVNMWGAANTQAGAPVYGALVVEAVWRTGTTINRVDAIGTILGGSGVATLNSIAPPVGTDNVFMRVKQTLNSWNAGTIVRVYADALAVTKP